QLGYYFRRNSLNNNSLYSANGYVEKTQSDYLEQWKMPGDEARTNVPRMIYPSNFNRSNLYSYSEVLVESGDHISFKDLQVTWSIPFFKQFKPQLTFWASNLGIIWRANSSGIDPRNLNT